MEKLRQQLDELLNRLERADEIRSQLQELISIYPFSEFEYIISHLLSASKLSIEEYYDIRNIHPPRIRIEVKTSRAVESGRDEPLYIKALSSDSTKPFDMNFQQIKPRYCDVFVWIAAWRDVIRYWVIPSSEVENNPYYSKGQHRGNVGEGQLHLTHENIHKFDRYLVKPNELEKAIQKAFKREQKLRLQSNSPARSRRRNP